MPTRFASALRAPTSARADRRRRRFARLWRLMDDAVDQQIRPAKSELFTDLPTNVVEIGPGRGANFGYLAPGTGVIAFEPNTHLHPDLREKAAEHGISLDLRDGDLQSGDLEDRSQDLVLSTLVLCSVDDVDATLREIARILRPGGRLIFVEHVAAPDGSALAWYQRAVRRPWRAIGDGCDTRNGTMDALARSGLRLSGTRLERLGSRLDPTALTWWGSATREPQ